MRQLRAEGHDVLSLDAGEPDFPTPDHIVAAAIAAAGEPRHHHYGAGLGLVELREAVAADAATLGRPARADNILVTSGAKQAAFNAIMSLVDPGDEVLVPAPYWVSYPAMVAVAGGSAVTVATDRRDAYRVLPDALEARRTRRTKLLILVTPGNPTGAVMSAQDLRDVGAWALANGIAVLVDETYRSLVHPPARFATLLAEVPELAGTCVVVDGVSKAYAMTGWRVGWLLGAPHVVHAAARLQGHSTSHPCNVAQAAAVAALTGPPEPLLDMRRRFTARRDKTIAALAGIDGVACDPPDGAFYAFPSVAGVVGRRVGDRVLATDVDLATVLLDKCRVAVVAGTAFGAPDHLRISYAAADEVLVEGLARLRRLLESAVSY